LSYILHKGGRVKKQNNERWFRDLLQRVPHEVPVDKAVQMVSRRTGALAGDAEHWIRQAVYSEGADWAVGRMREHGLL
jgi:hypothetical protein